MAIIDLSLEYLRLRKIFKNRNSVELKIKLCKI